MRRPIVDRVRGIVALKHCSCRIVLTCEVIRQAAVEIVDFRIGIDQLNQPKIGIIRKRLILHCMAEQSKGLIFLPKLKIGLARQIIHLRVDVIVGGVG